MTPDPTPPVVLATERDRVVEILSHNFAYDRISIDELERRLELTYKAESVSALRALTADLAPVESAPAKVQAPARVPVPHPAVAAPEDAGNRGRIVAVMSESRRRGVWAVPQELKVVACMSDTAVDLREAVLPGGVVNIHVNAVMASVKLIVPPNIHVVNRANAFMGAVREISHTRGVTPQAGATVVRVTGLAFMAELQIIVAGEPMPGDY